MRWQHRLLGWAFFLLPTIVLTVASAVYLVRLAKFLSPRLAPVVAQIVADSIHREVKIGRTIAFATPGEVLLENVEVSNTATFATDRGLPAMKADALQLQYSLPYLLAHPTQAPGCIETVKLIQPTVYVERLNTSTFNFSDLLVKKSKKQPAPFLGVVTASDGTAVVKDDAAPLASMRSVNVFHNITATVDFSSATVVKFSGRGTGNPLLLPAFAVQGQVLRLSAQSNPGIKRAKKLGYGLDVKFVGANVARLLPYILSKPGISFRVTKGTATGDVSVKQVGTIHSPIYVVGSAQVNNAQVLMLGKSLLATPVNNINATTTFTQQDASFAGSGTLNGQVATLTGTLLGFKAPQVFVAADTTIRNYKQLRTAIPSLPQIPTSIQFLSPIAVHAWVAGPLKNPTADASLSIPRMSAGSYIVRNVAADVTYGSKSFNVHSLTFDSPIGSGFVSASGVIDAGQSPTAFSFTGEARSLNLAKLSLTPSLRNVLDPIDGLVNAQFAVDQNGYDARLGVEHGQIRGIPFQSAEAELLGQVGGPIRIRSFFIRQPGSGALVATGTVPSRPDLSGLKVNFRAASIDLAQIQSPSSKNNLHGLAYFHGTVNGTELLPVVAANVYVLQPAYGQFSADVLRADVSGGLKKLVVNQLSIRHVPGRIIAAGTVDNLDTGDPSLDLKVTMTDFPTSYVASEISPKGPAHFPITGFISGAGTVRGTLASPQAAGELTLANGTFQDFQLTNTSVRLRYYQNVIDIDGFAATIAGAEVSGSGTYYGRSGAVDVRFNATTSNIEQIAQRYSPGIELFGALDASGWVTGNIKTPSAVVTVSTKSVSLEGTSLAINPATIDYFDNKLDLSEGPLIISTGPAKYVLSKFSLDLNAAKVDASASITGETVTHLISIVRNSPLLQKRIGQQLQTALGRMPQAPTGRLDVTPIDVTGDIKRPTIGVTADLTDASIAGQTIDRLHMQVVATGSKVQLEAFNLTGPASAYIAASGSYVTGGQINGNLEASGFSLALLDPYLPVRSTAAGDLSDLSVVASGQAAAPELSASITITKPTYNGLSLDRIDSGEIDLRNDHISINDLTFTKEEKTPSGSVIDHTLDVSGSIPFQWRNAPALSATIPTDVPFSLTAVVPEQSLAFVNETFPDLALRVPTGTMQAKLVASGTLQNKVLNGNIDIDGASVSLAGYQTSLKNLNADLLLNGSQITIQQFTADSNCGGTIGISGTGNFAGADFLDTTTTTTSILSDLQLALKVEAKDLILNERKIAVFNNAGASARFNNGFTIEGPVLRPTIAGEVDVDKVIGSLPQTSSTPAVERGVPLFNPRFNVTVNIKTGAQVRTAQLDAQADGSVDLTGSLYRPRVTGTFLIRKGQFYFPTATFKVVPVGTLKFSYSPPDDIHEDVQITAVTSITVSPDIIARNPAGVNTTQTYVPSLTPTSAGTAQRYVVTVNVDGDIETPDKLQLTFQSNPPGLTDAQILAVLGGQEAIAGLANGNVQHALQDQVASVFNASVVPKILQPFEDTIGSALGLDEFSIDYAPQSPVQVTIVKRLGGKLSVTYTQSVESRSPGAVSTTLEPPVYQVKLGYSFTPRLQATISTDDQHNNIVAIEGVHNF